MSRFEGSVRLDTIAAGASVWCGALALFAMRSDPVLSPDSVAYLSAAEHFHRGAGLTDFTGEPLTVFGPIYPLLLSPGGRSLVWASIVGAAAVAIATMLLFVLLRRRVRPLVALVAAIAFGMSQGLVRVSSTVWSETPYIAISLAALVVLTRTPMLRRHATAGGLLAGLGFLTRYAGAGLIITGGVMVLIVGWPAQGRARWRLVAWYLVAAGLLPLAWVVRNLIRAGDLLGPRFEGGTSEGFDTLVERPFRAVGELMMGRGSHPATALQVGLIVLIAVALVMAVAAWKRPTRILDVGMAAFMITSLVVPVVARMVTSNDIEYRVMSPMLVPIVYAAALAIDPWCRWRLGVALAGSAAVLWAYQGVVIAIDVPDTLRGSAGAHSAFSPQLYDIVATLPADVNVLTNNPQRLWWHTGHEPVLFAFTRPRPGNSHYPLSADDTLHQACSGTTYLAWFEGLANAGDGPHERRPDLMQVVDLHVEQTVPGGELFQVVPRDMSLCTS